MDAQGFLSPDQTTAGQGVHLLGERYGCGFAASAVKDAKILRTVCLSVTRASGLRVVGAVFHQLEPQGVTETVLLAESHPAIHTWPETGFVTADVYVCNYLADNTDKALNLYGALRGYFQPVRENFSQVSRGEQPT